MEDNTYQFDDVDTSSSESAASQSSAGSQGGGQSSGGYQGGRGGSFADEIHSITHHARQRTFYFDLKQSANGKFLKISEKSRGGRKTTIMMDEEDIKPFLDALKEMHEKISA